MGQNSAIDDLFKSNPDQIDCFTFFGGDTWLGFAAHKGKIRAVEKLIAIGFDINKGNKHDGILPICCAADNGHFSVVKFLLEKGSKLDDTKSVTNPLLAAITGCSPNIVKLLLSSGIDFRKKYNMSLGDNVDAISYAMFRGERACALEIALWQCNGNKEEAATLVEQTLNTIKRNAKRLM